ncbi:MAG TPA: hypothetical protein VKP14_06265, partial [Gaiellaceae bacterium]|nr:hypothetical protein [Gaiellaceae bacterium]
PPANFPSDKAGPVFVAAQTTDTTGAMANFFAPGSTVVFRAYAVDVKTKKLVASKQAKFFYVSIPGQPNVKLTYDPTGTGASKGFPWIGKWTVPATFTPGLVPFKILVKLTSHRTGQFVQMPVSAAQLTISATPPAVFGPPASGGEIGLVDSSGKINYAVYVDTVNGTRPVGAAPRAAGCSQTNVFKRGEQVVVRSWGHDLTTQDILSTDNISAAHFSIAGQPDVTLNWGAHGATGAKVNFWSNAWIVQADYPLGQTTIHVVYTTESGKTITYDHLINIIP